MDSRFEIPVWLALVIAIALITGWKVARAVYESEWQKALALLAIAVIGFLGVALVAAWGWL